MEPNPEVHLHPRRAILIIPGGGYEWVSRREGEAVALRFLGLGYNAYVLHYSTRSESDNTYPVQLYEAVGAVKIIHLLQEEDYTDLNDLSICGFSAGGHLCALLGLIGNNLEYREAFDFAEPFPINAIAPIYAVLSNRVETIRGSFDNLIGESGTKPEAISPDLLVTKKSPRLFLVASSNDELVPIVNSLSLAMAYAKKKLPFEIHIWEKAPHGFSVGNETVGFGPGQLNEELLKWPELLDYFIRNKF
jgi:acetyl esterase/lipase